MTILKALELLFKQKCGAGDIVSLPEEKAIDKTKEAILNALNDNNDQELVEKVSNIPMSLFDKYVNVLYNHLMRTESDISWK